TTLFRSVTVSAWACADTGRDNQAPQRNPAASTIRGAERRTIGCISFLLLWIGHLVIRARHTEAKANGPTISSKADAGGNCKLKPFIANGTALPANFHGHNNYRLNNTPPNPPVAMAIATAARP